MHDGYVSWKSAASANVVARLDVPHRGRASVAQELEDLEVALREQVERGRRVSLEEQRLVRRQPLRLGESREPLELAVVQVLEELGGAQVGERSVVDAHGASISGAARTRPPFS